MGDDGYEWRLTVKGGPGSGHWGHAGRPGQVGGSAPGGGERSAAMDAEFEAAARRDNIVEDWPLGGGVTDSRLMEFRGDGRGVWKADEMANSAMAEVMADELDDLLGLGVVPHTVLVENHFGDVGSCQRFVDGATMAYDLYEEGKLTDMLQANRERVEGMILLDYITGNQDRHYGNVIFDKDGQLWAVDNGAAWNWGRFPRGALDWAMDLEPGMARTGPYILSSRTLEKLRGFTRSQFDEMVCRHVNGPFSLPNGLDEAWEKIAKIQQAGELRW